MAQGVLNNFNADAGVGGLLAARTTSRNGLPGVRCKIGRQPILFISSAHETQRLRRTISHPFADFWRMYRPPCPHSEPQTKPVVTSASPAGCRTMLRMGVGSPCLTIDEMAARSLAVK